MRTFLVIALALVSLPLFADQIYLKNGSVLVGTISSRSAQSVVYLSENTKQTEEISTRLVSKLVYNNGEVIVMDPVTRASQPEVVEDEDAEERQDVPVESKDFYFGFELGWNGVSGLGVRADWHPGGAITLFGAAGLGMWGYRVSGGLRYYFEYPYGFSLGAGMSYNTGLDGVKVQGMSTEDAFGNTYNEEVTFDYKPVATINFSVMWTWDIGEDSKTYLELGYAIPTEKPEYTYTSESGNTLTRESKDITELLAPGGIIIACGIMF